MRTQVTWIIDNPPRECYHERGVSRGSGRYHGRTERGEHPRKGSIMVKVTNHPSTFELRWCCKICRERCSMDTLWLAFPRGSVVEGQWVHRGCVDGRVHDFFGRRVVLMRGVDALRQLAQSLHDVADDPALARQRPLVRAKA